MRQLRASGLGSCTECERQQARELEIPKQELKQTSNLNQKLQEVHQNTGQRPCPSTCQPGGVRPATGKAEKTLGSRPESEKARAWQ